MRSRVIAILVSILVVLAAGIILIGHAHAPVVAHQTTTQVPKPGFNKAQFSTTDSTSIWVVVNKSHALQPINYVPASLVIPTIMPRSGITSDERQVSAALEPSLDAMTAAAKADGQTLILLSGYRSYSFQVNLYNSYVVRDGRSQADLESARPGHSEHQTGLAVDIGGITTPSCNLSECFATTPEGKWLAAHGSTYGFIIRYTAEKQSITGYESEPWHLRYIGKELAAEMQRQKVTTLEEFFGITGGGY